MQRLECRERTNSDVWIHHVACKFPRFFHKPPTLYCYWETIIAFKWQKQGSRIRFKPLTGWGQHTFVWKFPREQLKARPIEWYHCQHASFSQLPIPLKSPGIFDSEHFCLRILHSFCVIRESTQHCLAYESMRKWRRRKDTQNWGYVGK